MGFEHFCNMLFSNIDLVAAVFKKYGDISVELMQRLASYDTVGAIWVGDDQAYKTSLMINPDIMREYVYPYYRRICDIAHENDIDTIFHSDGAIGPIIPDLIACGFDCLHPFEPDAMDIYEAKARYGKKVCISGNINIGTILAEGSPSQVEEEVTQMIKRLAPKGGYVLSSSNSMTEFVPLNNFIAVMKTLHKIGKYPLV